mmetsp:Transcript_3691/g.11464  ORF Transcript_3691/g.11464 Transcript_3691/m.11464 type:complete len:202 (-) Transcript_3691:224-829(-)
MVVARVAGLVRTDNLEVLPVAARLQQVELSRKGPGAVRVVRGQQPNSRPDPVALREAESHLRGAVAELELVFRGEFSRYHRRQRFVPLARVRAEAVAVALFHLERRAVLEGRADVRRPLAARQPGPRVRGHGLGLHHQEPVFRVDDARVVGVRLKLAISSIIQRALDGPALRIDGVEIVEERRRRRPEPKPRVPDAEDARN